MANKVTITVEPSEGHHETLIVQDAFHQAIDIFNLLTDDTDRNVVWKLDRVSMDSPFICQGLPVDTRTGAGAHTAVAQRLKVVARNFERIVSGQDFDDAFPKDKIKTVQKLLKRNTNGIGRTTAKFFEGSEPLEITQETANRYFTNVVEPAESLHSYLFSRTSRQEHGSIEGRIVDIGTDYDAPAIHLEEHKTGQKIWCRINVNDASRLAEEIRAVHVWEHNRVRVKGVVNYDEEGRTTRIIGGSVGFIMEEIPYGLDKLEDSDFTGQYPIREYLDRLQENEFGDQ